MDAGQKHKHKSGKGDFENAIKGNEEIRNMRFHHMTFDELQEALETNIDESKYFLVTRKNDFYRKRIDSRSSH